MFQAFLHAVAILNEKAIPFDGKGFFISIIIPQKETKLVFFKYMN